MAAMRNGVLAITRSGAIALINDEAYRVFGLEPSGNDIGRPVSDVLRDLPDVVRVLTDACEATLLPNLAELRLKPSCRRCSTSSDRYACKSNARRWQPPCTAPHTWLTRPPLTDSGFHESDHKRVRGARRFGERLG